MVICWWKSAGSPFWKIKKNYVKLNIVCFFLVIFCLRLYWTLPFFLSLENLDSELQMNLASNLYKFWLIRKTFDAFSRNRIFQNNHSKLALQDSFSSRNMSNKGPTQGAAWYDRKKGFQLYHLYWKWLLISKILLLGRISLNVIGRNLKKKNPIKSYWNKQTNYLNIDPFWPYHILERVRPTTNLLIIPDRNFFWGIQWIKYLKIRLEYTVTRDSHEPESLTWKR